MRDNDAALGETARQKRDHVRHLAHQLNLRGGLTLLDAIAPAALTAFLRAESRRYTGG